MSDFRPQHMLPRTVNELIDMLDAAFPLRNLDVNLPLHAIQREYGKRDVIDFLRQLQKDAKENVEEIFER
jgi:hypothetical protein